MTALGEADDSVVLLAPTAVTRDLDEESGSVLLDLETAGYFSINATGRDIISLLDGRTVGAVIAGIREREPDAPEELGSDVREFLGALVERGLATVNG